MILLGYPRRLHIRIVKSSIVLQDIKLVGSFSKCIALEHLFIMTIIIMFPSNAGKTDNEIYGYVLLNVGWWLQ